MSNVESELTIRDRLAATIAAGDFTDRPVALAEWLESLVGALRSEAFQAGYETGLAVTGEEGKA